MNRQSGSVVQNVSFLLLVFIAAAMTYLLVKERARARNEAAAQAAAALPAPPATDTARPVPSSEPVSPTNYAPLRPRSEPNPGRVFTNRLLSGARPPAPPPRSAVAVPVAEEPPLPPVLTPAESVQPVPAALATGVGGGTGTGGYSLVGRVTLNGVPPPEKVVQLDALCGRLHPQPMTTRHYVVSPEGGLANVLVYIKAGLGPDSARQDSLPVLDNVACEFQPYVLGVRANQPFLIRNSDAVLHNVHGLPASGSRNREFNLGLPVKGQSVRRVIESPEVFVKLKCDVHPWMFAYLGVVEHRWFAVTDATGAFALPGGLPPGQYTLAAVHLKAGETTQNVTVTIDAVPSLQLSLSVPP